MPTVLRRQTKRSQFMCIDTLWNLKREGEKEGVKEKSITLRSELINV